METFKTNVQLQIQYKMNWCELGDMLYVIDYSKFIKGLETEAEAENNCYTYWPTKKGLQFQDERSRIAYVNNATILAQKY
jgi:hypothetical protein